MGRPKERGAVMSHWYQGQFAVHRPYAARAAQPGHRRRSRHGPGQDRGTQSRLFGEVPHRRRDDLGRREARPAGSRQGARRADQRQHRHRAGFRRRRPRHPADPDDAGDHERRAAQAADRARRQAGAHRGAEGHERRDRQERGDRRLRSRALRSAPAVQEPGQPRHSRGDHRAGNLERHRRRRRHLRVGRRHRRHHHRRLALHQTQAGKADRLGRRRADGEPGAHAAPGRASR